jgi:hypothetical protein
MAPMLSSKIYAELQAGAPFEGLGDEVNELVCSKRFTFDFAVLGGAISTIQLLDDQGLPAVLPVGSVIRRAFLDVVTSFTSGGAATVALQCMVAADLLAATAVASLAAGLVDCKPVNTAATSIKVATGSQNLVRKGQVSVAAQPIQAVIAAATLTAGKAYLHVEFVRSSVT